MQILSWSAVVLLSTSYWFQIWKIHVHKEVRDLSMVYHVMLALGFGILTYTAYIEGSVIFIVKQIATTVPVIVIITQILYHKDDHWHDNSDPMCIFILRLNKILGFGHDDSLLEKIQNDKLKNIYIKESKMKPVAIKFIRSFIIPRIEILDFIYIYA